MENVMQNQIETALDSLKTLWEQVLQFLPHLIIGIGLMVVGLLIAKLVRKLLIKLLKLIRLDVAAEKAGIEDFLLKGGAQYSPVNILANLFYWFFMLAVTLTVLHSFGIDAAKDLFDRILLFIPDVVVAILVLIFGSLFARLARGATYTYLSNIGVSGAEFISNIAHWTIIFLVISVALQQLSLGGQVLISAFEMAFGGLCLALALAFGLAGKEWASQILEKLWRNSR